MTLDEFLAALDEDEATAKAAYCYGPNPNQPTAPPEGSWWTSAQLIGRLGLGTYNDARHIVRHDPGRVLREVAAIRAIIDEFQSDNEPIINGPEYYAGLWFALCHLAPERLEP